MAVRILSPVHITFLIPASDNSSITPAELGFNLFSKMMNPKNSRPDSASLSFHLLNLDPIELFYVLSSTCNDSKPPMGVVR